MLYAIFALLVIILDQWVKFWVAGNIAFQTESVEVIPGILSMVNIHNTGAAFSFMSGANATYFFIGLAVVVALVVIILLATKVVKGPLARLSLVFIMAGGLGNCIDRILYGYVQDMFKVEFFNFAIFNVADIFITLFCIIFILCVLFGRNRRDDDDDYEDDYEYEDEDDEDEEEEEEPKMSRRERKAAAKAAKAEKRESKKAKKAEKYYDDDEDDDEDEEEDDMVAPSKRPTPAKEPKPTRRERQQKVNDDYAQFKAARAAKMQAGEVSTEPTRRVTVVDPSNPFAEWENKAPVDEEFAIEDVPVVKAPVEPKKPVAPVKPAEPVKAPVVKAAAKAPVAKVPAAKAPVAKAPVAKAAPAPAPVAKAPVEPKKPAAPAVEEEFNLDDILAEFR